MNPQPSPLQQPPVLTAQQSLALIEQRIAYLTVILEEVAEQQKEVRRVDVVNADMGFGTMVWFMVKWALASIPAVIFLLIMGTTVAVLFSSFFAVLLALLRGLF